MSVRVLQCAALHLAMYGYIVLHAHLSYDVGTAHTVIWLPRHDMSNRPKIKKEINLLSVMTCLKIDLLRVNCAISPLYSLLCY